eukprot:8190660-Pyramimonas_sp.AAC.1
MLGAMAAVTLHFHPLSPFGLPRRPVPFPEARLRPLPFPGKISSRGGPVRDVRNVGAPLPCNRRRVPLPLPLPFDLNARRSAR